MDVFDLLLTVLRRWYVAVPLLAASIAFALSGYSSTPPSYEASSTLLFVGPNTSLEYVGEEEVLAVPQNPLINLSGAQIAAVSTARALLDDEVGAALAEAGLDLAYGVNVDNRSPLMVISTSSLNEDDALEGLEMLVETANETLIERQDALGAPERTRLSFEGLTSPADAVQVNSDRMQAALIRLAGALLLSTVLVVGFDALARRRARRALAAHREIGSDADREVSDVAVSESRGRRRTQLRSATRKGGEDVQPEFGLADGGGLPNPTSVTEVRPSDIAESVEVSERQVMDGVGQSDARRRSG